MKVQACLTAALFGLLLSSSAYAQNASGGFGSMSPGAYGNGGGGQSDFQKVQEDMVKKMRDGSYVDLIRQGQENVDAFARLRAREGRQAYP